MRLRLLAINELAIFETTFEEIDSLDVKIQTISAYL